MDESAAMEELLPVIERVVDDVRMERFINFRYREEMVSDANLGAILAIRAFDDRFGVSLAAYARHRIRGQILDGIRKRSGKRQLAGQEHQHAVQLELFPLEILEGVAEEQEAFRHIDTLDLLDRMFGKLDNEQREILRQRFLQEKTTTAMAKDRNLTPWQMKYRLNAALANAKSILEGQSIKRQRVA